MRYIRAFLLVVIMGGSFNAIAGNYEDALNYAKEGRKLRMLLALEKAADEDENVEAMFRMGLALLRAEREPSFRFFADQAVSYSVRFFARAAYKGDVRAFPAIGMLCMESVFACSIDSDSKKYTWAYMWFVLAGSTLNQGEMKYMKELGKKMTAAEREEGQKLAQEFKVFIEDKKTVAVENVAACPESWTKFTRNACRYFNGSNSYSFIRSPEVIDEISVFARHLREEDVNYENRVSK